MKILRVEIKKYAFGIHVLLSGHKHSSVVDSRHRDILKSALNQQVP